MLLLAVLFFNADMQRMPEQVANIGDERILGFVNILLWVTVTLAVMCATPEISEGRNRTQVGGNDDHHYTAVAIKISG